MHSAEVRFRVTGSEDGIDRLTRYLPALLLYFGSALRGFTLLPRQGDVAACIISITLDFGDTSIEARAEDFRRELTKRPGVTSAEIVIDLG